MLVMQGYRPQDTAPLPAGTGGGVCCGRVGGPGEPPPADPLLRRFWGRIRGPDPHLPAPGRLAEEPQGTAHLRPGGVPSPPFRLRGESFYRFGPVSPFAFHTAHMLIYACDSHGRWYMAHHAISYHTQPDVEILLE